MQKIKTAFQKETMRRRGRNKEKICNLGKNGRNKGDIKSVGCNMQSENLWDEGSKFLVIPKPIGIAKRCFELSCDIMGYVWQNGATFRPQVAQFWLTCRCLQNNFFEARRWRAKWFFGFKATKYGPTMFWDRFSKFAQGVANYTLVTQCYYNEMGEWCPFRKKLQVEVGESDAYISMLS